MFGSLGRSITRVRTARGVTQAYLAGVLGIPRALLSQWESGQRAVPRERLPSLAEALGVSTDSLLELWTPPGTARLEEVRRQKMPPYPVKYSLADVPLSIRSAISLTPAEGDEMEHAFPRDRPEELTASLQLLRYRGQLKLLSPLDLGCRLPIVRPLTETYAGDRLHHAIRVQFKERELIAFPQVALLVVKQAQEYRVDFLVRWRGQGIKLWAYIEIQGPCHADTPAADFRRVRGIPLRRLAFESHEVDSPAFVSRVVARLRHLEQSGRSTPAVVRTPR